MSNQTISKAVNHLDFGSCSLVSLALGLCGSCSLVNLAFGLCGSCSLVNLAFGLCISCCLVNFAFGLCSSCCLVNLAFGLCSSWSALPLPECGLTTAVCTGQQQLTRATHTCIFKPSSRKTAVYVAAYTAPLLLIRTA